jgi:hypothetical protein
MGVVNRSDSNKLDTNRTIKEISIFVDKCVMFQGMLIHIIVTVNLYFFVRLS